MTTWKKLEKIKSGEFSAEDNIRGFLHKIKQENKRINAFLYVAEKEAVDAAKNIDTKIRNKGKIGRLAGLAVAVKSNINVIGMPISCASNTLEQYHGTYDADVIQKIKEEDGIIIGITNCDEFAAGSSGEHSAFGPTLNPKAMDRIPGGSSSGSAAAVVAGFCDLALGSDTGGSIRNPASHCGIVGIKPSYGRVSRYGLIDLSMSLDQIGPFSQDVFGAALLLEVISGKSGNDAVTSDAPVDTYSRQTRQTPVNAIKIGICKDFEELCQDKRIHALIMSAAEKLAKETGSKLIEFHAKNLKLGVQTYYPIVYTEFFSATRKFDGRRYGKKIEESCGEEVLRRILGGREISRAEYAGRYYRKALAVKNLIAKDFSETFKKVDIILSPVTPILPHTFSTRLTPQEEYAYDAFTIPSNLAGICAGVVPCGTIDGIPVGIQIMAPAFAEKLLIAVMRQIEELHNNQ
ncbi:MAG: Asp-tRNA(Asn)/Glu-tRNA(Gln) amidotransferase subunit GatA [Nanoarchaeota archaeon]